MNSTLIFHLIFHLIYGCFEGTLTNAEHSRTKITKPIFHDGILRRR